MAEALEHAGAPREKIFLVSSHAPNLDALCATNAARRWQRFRAFRLRAKHGGQQKQ